jgi:4-amino-4-deoxy-L-arabinose transferase-like glycosyltransferase
VRTPSMVFSLGILAAAVVLRIFWSVHQSTVLVGCEYVRIAENLLNSGTYVGLFEGPALMFPPFFPVLLVFGSFLAGSTEGAARLIPVLAGVALVPVAFTLARLMYGLRVAFGVAALTALHPVLIDLSSTAESESVYLLLMLAGLYWGLRALDSNSLTYTVWCSAMFGLAYLTRPEALFYPFVFLGAMLVSDLRSRVPVGRFALRCLCLFVPIVALAAPYVAYLWVHTGSLRLEGKGIMNYTIGERRNAGMGHPEASLGIGPDLSEDGPQLSPNHFIATADRLPSIRRLGSYWVKSALRNKTTLFEYLLLPYFGSALGMGLIMLGLFRQPWDQRRAGREAVLLSIAVGHFLLLLGLHGVLFRYVLPLMTVSLLWVSKGIDDVARWGVGTARRAVPLWRTPLRWVDVGIRCGLIVVLLLMALWGLRWDPFEGREPKAVLLKETGTWLDHYRPGPKRVMTLYPQVPYYARGTFLLMPYAEASLALRYVHLKHPDFIVLTAEEGYMAPYLRQWLIEGIPDRAAELIFSAGGTSPVGVAIYEWHG